MSGEATLPADLESASLEEVKKTFQHMSAHAAVNLLHEYLDMVSVSQDPEVKRKALLFVSEMAAMGAPKPKEERQDYPVLHFNIGSAPLQVTASTPDGRTQTLEFTPSEVMAANTYVNADVNFDD